MYTQSAIVYECNDLLMECVQNVIDIKYECTQIWVRKIKASLTQGIIDGTLTVVHASIAGNATRGEERGGEGQ